MQLPAIFTLNLHRSPRRAKHKTSRPAAIVSSSTLATSHAHGTLHQSLIVHLLLRVLRVNFGAVYGCRKLQPSAFANLTRRNRRVDVLKLRKAVLQCICLSAVSGKRPSPASSFSPRWPGRPLLRLRRHRPHFLHLLLTPLITSPVPPPWWRCWGAIVLSVV